jgi:hypothetical protein
MHLQACVHEHWEAKLSISPINLKLFLALHSQEQETNHRPRNVPIIILKFAKQNTTTAAAAIQATVPMSKANGDRYTTDYMARKRRKSHLVLSSPLE